MRKSTVIANCLVNSNMFRDIEEAESAVRKIFYTEFPDHNFSAWNENIPDKTAQNIISKVGKASRINVEQFIKDLWE
jgi:hypothetical protein